MYIDFKELDADGIHLELLVQELMLLEGLDVHWEGVGPDNKKDLAVLERVNGKSPERRAETMIASPS